MLDLREDKFGSRSVLIKRTEILGLAFRLTDPSVADDVRGEVLADLTGALLAVCLRLEPLIFQLIEDFHLVSQAATKTVLRHQHPDTAADIETFQKRFTLLSLPATAIRYLFDLRADVVERVIWRQDTESRFREHLVKHLERRLVEPRGTVDRVTDNHPAIENVLAQSVDRCRRELHLANAAQQDRRHRGWVVAKLAERRLGGHILKVLGARLLMELHRIIGGEVPILGQIHTTAHTTAPLHFAQQIIRRRWLDPLALWFRRARDTRNNVAGLTSPNSLLQLFVLILMRLHEPVIGRALLPERDGRH